MKKNVGKTDQLIRYSLAAAFLVVAIVTQIWWFLIGTVLMVATALVGFCGLYRVFGFTTCKVALKKEEEKE